MHFLIDAIRERSADNAAAPALISPHGSIAYDELVDFVMRIANAFADRGVPRMARAYLNIRDPDLRLMVTLAAFHYGLIPALAVPETLKRDYDYDVTIGSRVPLRPDVQADLVVDEAILTGKFADGRPREYPERADDDLSYVTETTGTTGRPKLLAVTHKAHSAFFSGADQRRFGPGDRVMVVMGGISRYGQNLAEAALASGAAMVGAPVDAMAALKMIALYEVSHIITTPKALEGMVELMERGNLRVPSVRNIGITGSLVSEELIRRADTAFDADISIRYGTSEVARVSAGRVTGATFRRGYVGEVRDSITIVGIGTREAPAPIVIANDVAHQTRYIEGGKIVVDDRPTFTLPDLGYLDGKSLYLTGRADEVFNLSGNKIAFDTIQQAFEAVVPGCDIGMADARPIGRDDQLVVAISAPTQLDLAAVRLAALTPIGLEKATDYVRVVQVDGVPRNAMGKVDRRAVLRLFQEAIGEAPGAG